MKKVVKLNESTIKKIVSEAVKRVLKEAEEGKSKKRRNRLNESLYANDDFKGGLEFINNNKMKYEKTYGKLLNERFIIFDMMNKKFSEYFNDLESANAAACQQRDKNLRDGVRCRIIVRWLPTYEKSSGPLLIDVNEYIC